MIRITSEAYHEKLDIPQDEIILNGPPSDLRGKIFLNNPQTEVLKIKSLPIWHGKELNNGNASIQALEVSCKMQPGEQSMTDVFHQIHPFTPPGTYEAKVQLGMLERKVKMIVQSEIKIDIHPSQFTFLGTQGGTVHTATCTLTNLGNVDFQIPEVSHVAALDMDLLCRAFGMAMRNKSGGGYEKVLDDISNNIQANLPDWARSKVEECGKILKPCESTLIHIQITMPANCDANKDYNGNMRFWDKDIAYVIKSHNQKNRKV